MQQPSDNNVVVDLSQEEDAEVVAVETELFLFLQSHIHNLENVHRRFGTTLEDDDDKDDDDNSVQQQQQHVSAAHLRLLYLQTAVENLLPGARWLFRHVRPRNHQEAMWDEHAPRTAAELGHLGVLEFLLDHGCPVFAAAACAAAAGGGHLAVLRLLREEYEADWDPSCVESAIVGNAPEVLLPWLLAHGAPVQPRALLLALERNSLDLCERLHVHDPSLVAQGATVEWTAIAAQNDRDPRLLRWLHTQGAPWDATCTAAAAGRKDPYLLVWAHTRGCVWDSSAAVAAIDKLRTDCFAYCLANNCPMQPSQMHYRLTDAVAHFQRAAKSDRRDTERDAAACRALLQPRLPLHPYFYPSLTTRKRRRAAMARSVAASSSSSSSSSILDPGTQQKGGEEEGEEEGSTGGMRSWLRRSVVKK